MLTNNVKEFILTLLIIFIGIPLVAVIVVFIGTFVIAGLFKLIGITLW